MLVSGVPWLDLPGHSQVFESSFLKRILATFESDRVSGPLEELRAETLEKMEARCNINQMYSDTTQRALSKIHREISREMPRPAIVATWATRVQLASRLGVQKNQHLSYIRQYAMLSQATNALRTMLLRSIVCHDYNFIALTFMMAEKPHRILAEEFEAGQEMGRPMDYSMAVAAPRVLRMVAEVEKWRLQIESVKIYQRT